MNTQEIRELMEQQKTEFFSGSLASIKDAQAGEPVPMLDETDTQTHWFIPFIDTGQVAGFAIVNLTGKVIMHGLLAPNANKKIDPAFFSNPDPVLLDEIETAYPDFAIESHSFSYDKIPQRWAWRIKLKNHEHQVTIFAGPTGWYEKKDRKPGWEG